MIKKLILTLFIMALAACGTEDHSTEKAVFKNFDKTASNNVGSKEEQKVKEKVSEKQSQPEAAPPTEGNQDDKYTSISWSEFFDKGDQTTPSNKFWDLKGKNVVINGYMGEVLSMGQGWFLLIPSPGAECPFDNGDETYWNKIMIVFVKDQSNLRYTGEALRVKGKLDVGVKIDESNYKTMFRLYDAEFEAM